MTTDGFGGGEGKDTDPRERKLLAKFPLPCRWGDLERMVNAVYKTVDGGADEWIGLDQVVGEVEVSEADGMLVVEWVPGAPG